MVGCIMAGGWGFGGRCIRLMELFYLPVGLLVCRWRGGGRGGVLQSRTPSNQNELLHDMERHDGRGAAP